MKRRMKLFAVRIIKIIDQMPRNQTSMVTGNQLLRSATSMAANYSACCRAKSINDFINKLKVVEEETDETIFWLDLLEETGFFNEEKLSAIKTEANEILSIIVASIKTVRRNSATSQNRKS